MQETAPQKTRTMPEPIALVAGERFGHMRDALNRAGVPAISCDMVQAVNGGPHIVASWFELIPVKRWSVIVTHYTCTALAVSGNAHYAAGKPKHSERLRAIEEAQRLWELCCNHSDIVVFENPRGVLGTQSRMGRAHDSVQPFEFGDNASKNTDLWLKGLGPIPRDPAARCTGRVVEWPRESGQMVERWENQTDSGQNKLPPSEGRAMERAKTYPGIASALASHIAAELTQRTMLF